MFLTSRQEQWIEEAKNTVIQIQENCERFIEKSETILQDIQRIKPKLKDPDPAQISENLVDHDPALRGEVRDDNQREYLVEVGPFQPRLSCFPTNPDIPQGKQNRFSPRWYDEYPHLEYSIERDAVFCFVCSLFDDTPAKEKVDPSWKTTGIRKWHKMKSVGKSKQGKLAQHFSSQSHKASLGAYCHFLKKPSISSSNWIKQKGQRKFRKLKIWNPTAKSFLSSWTLQRPLLAKLFPSEATTTKVVIFIRWSFCSADMYQI